MKILAIQLESLFEDGPYTESPVEITRHGDSSLAVVCKVPGFTEPEECSAELVEDYETIYDFISEFMLRSLKDLQEITPELMYRRFQTGRCNLYCYIEPDREIYLLYRWQKDKLTATAFDEQQHEVPIYANTPEELMVYARYYLENILSK